ncbi:hypothetical protein INT45_011906 [Circinella minor]|uniref:Uncharacterized protein n=1 Tax=Circinella minor TaxID=1195481 RepID=A0A8H7RVK0_9FUNG|nr:hypothetical protein INT45_011906 [Circinella minor]
MYDPDFRVVRSECNSTVEQKLKAIGEMDDNSKLRKWNFIYRHIGEQYELFICEDKPDSASPSAVQKDSKKCDKLRIDMLKTAIKDATMTELIELLETITAQTHGLEMTIRGTRKIGDTFVHYTKAQVTIPSTISSKCAALAEFLAVVISLQIYFYTCYTHFSLYLRYRATMLNFVRLQIALESSSSYNVQYLSNEPDSPNSSQESNEGYSAAQRSFMDTRKKEHLDNAKEEMKQVKHGDRVLVANNLEMLYMLAQSKKTTYCNDDENNNDDSEKED